MFHFADQFTQPLALIGGYFSVSKPFSSYFIVMNCRQYLQLVIISCSRTGYHPANVLIIWFGGSLFRQIDAI